MLVPLRVRLLLLVRGEQFHKLSRRNLNVDVENALRVLPRNFLHDGPVVPVEVRAILYHGFLLESQLVHVEVQHFLHAVGKKGDVHDAVEFHNDNSCLTV